MSVPDSPSWQCKKCGRWHSWKETKYKCQNIGSLLKQAEEEFFEILPNMPKNITTYNVTFRKKEQPE